MQIFEILNCNNAVWPTHHEPYGTECTCSDCNTEDCATIYKSFGKNTTTSDAVCLHYTNTQRFGCSFVHLIIFHCIIIQFGVGWNQWKS